MYNVNVQNFCFSEIICYLIRDKRFLKLKNVLIFQVYKPTHVSTKFYIGGVQD